MDSTNKPLNKRGLETFFTYLKSLFATQSTVEQVRETIPTKTSQLTNDSGFKTTDNNTTYALSKDGDNIILTGSDGSTTTVIDSNDNTTYTHPSSHPATMITGLADVATSGDYKDLDNTPNINDDESDNFAIADDDGNVIFKVDDEGVHTTALTVDGEALGAAALKDVKEYSTNQYLANNDNQVPTVTTLCNFIQVTSEIVSGTIPAGQTYLEVNIPTALTLNEVLMPVVGTSNYYVSLVGDTTGTNPRPTKIVFYRAANAHTNAMGVSCYLTRLKVMKY